MILSYIEIHDIGYNNMYLKCSIYRKVKTNYLLIILNLDYSAGFGGKFGVQKDRQDKVCCSFILLFLSSL